MTGRPTPRSRAAPVIGIDVGGTSTKLGLLTEGGDALERFRSLPTGAQRPRDDVLHDLAGAVRSLAAETEAAGSGAVAIGVGLPAAMSREGRIEVLPNFAPGWSGVQVAEELRARTGIASVVVNDARAFTLAEATFGAAAGARAAFGVTLGTGVGGGLVLDGELYTGPSGKAGEFGHHVVDRHGPLCGCGSHGCLETYASATALVASVTRPFLRGTAARLCELADGRLEAVTPPLVAEAAARGDDVCREALDRVATVLGVAIANVTTLVAVERVVVGGGMAGLGDDLFTPLRRALRAYAPVVGDDLPAVVPARLGDTAGALGAALVALRSEARAARTAGRSAGSTGS